MSTCAGRRHRMRAPDQRHPKGHTTGSRQRHNHRALYNHNAPRGAGLPRRTIVAGGSQPHDNMQPYTVLNYIIALAGVFPSRN